MIKWILPTLLCLFGGMSILTLRSIAPHLVTSQIVFFSLGFVLFWLISRLHFQVIRRWSWLLYVIEIVLLIIPLVLGTTNRGIMAWIHIGPFFSIQPSQLALPIVALMLAHYMSQHSMKLLQNRAISLVLAALPGILIALEPDLGTLLVYAAGVGTIFFLSDIAWSWIFGLAATATVFAIVSWLFLLQPYQKDRITSFLNQDDLQGSGYNAHQALIAVGSGQFMGRGLGQGVQSHLRFLPERQTDFIFASLAEELGFIGSLLVMGLTWMLIVTMIWIATHTDDSAGVYLCAAGAALFLVQAGINMGMNMGLVPITGITLPFLSAGGSSILSLAALLGVFQSLAQSIKPQPGLHLS